MLGFTATSNRMDGNSVYEVLMKISLVIWLLFDALEHKLIVPFHYYWNKLDIQSIDYENMDLSKIDFLQNFVCVNKGLIL